MAFIPINQYRAATAAEVRELDRAAIEDYGVPGAVLMENAGVAVVEAAVGMTGPASDPLVVLLCGKGNNGGDGYVIARHLHNRGYGVRVFLTHAPDEIGGDARVNLDIIRKMSGIPRTVISAGPAWADLENSLAEADLIIDALLGTGLQSNVREPFDSLIQLINGASKPTLSVDIPSGLSADTGQTMGHCVRATRTVTFALVKKGLLMGGGPERSGELLLAEIGIPIELLARYEP